MIPSLIQLESTTACNGKCKFCPVGAGLDRKGGSMSDELFLKIVKEATQLGIKQILLFLNGEPFVFKRFFDWLEILRQHGRTTIIYTNAGQLTKEKADRLVTYSDVVENIVFSLSGKDKKTHMEIMGLDHDTVKENVRYFMQVNKGRIPATAQMPYFSMTASWVTEWKKVWEPIVGTAGATSMFNWGGNIEDSIELKGRRIPCPRLHHITILYDGRVSLCCMDAEGEVILGDLNTQTIEEIYSGPVAQKFRRMHLEGRYEELPLCNHCNLNMR